MTSEKAKKFWAIAVVINIAIMMIAGVSVITFATLEPEIMKDAYVSSFFKGIFGGLIIGLVGYTAACLVLYFRSYKKLNTGFLTFIVVAGVVNMPKQLSTVHQYFRLKHSAYATYVEQYSAYFAVFGAVLLLMILGGYFWLYSCAMLRRMNFDEKGLIIKGKKVYEPAIASLKNADSLDVLNASFTDSKKEHSEITWYLKRVFRKKKKELK